MFFKLLFNGLGHLKDILMSKWYKSRMKSCGYNVTLRPSTSVYLGLENLSLGNNVSIPRYSHIFCTDAPLTIGNNGTPIFLSYDKLLENDAPVSIEDDVWIGAHVTILKGVTIGRGSVIAAGCVVNKSTPPYSISVGVPAKMIKFRFTIDEILEHERILYLENERYTREELEKIFSETKLKK